MKDRPRAYVLKGPHIDKIGTIRVQTLCMMEYAPKLLKLRAERAAYWARVSSLKAQVQSDYLFKNRHIDIPHEICKIKESC